MCRSVRLCYAVLMLAVTAAPSWLSAAQVKLDVSMAQPTLLAEQKQTTFVKVGLMGFKMSSKGDYATRAMWKELGGY